MPKVRVGRVLADAQVSEVEALWLDPESWTRYVDGFGALARTDGEWPHPGARVVWDSRPGGRGRVVEDGDSYEPGAKIVTTLQDGEMTGTQTVTLGEDDLGVRMEIELQYDRTNAGALKQATESLFVKSALKASLKRTLERFDQELAIDREEASDPS